MVIVRGKGSAVFAWHIKKEKRSCQALPKSVHDDSKTQLIVDYKIDASSKAWEPVTYTVAESCIQTLVTAYLAHKQTALLPPGT